MGADPRPPARVATLRQTVEHGGFAWLTGIEDTFITAPHARTGRTLDEYELTEHYARWADDVGLIGELGVSAARYGVPWHRINPARDRWDFSWAERPVDRLLKLGVEPVLDLVHYGVPDWIEHAFLNPDYPARVEEYAAKVAEHFRGRVRAFTPLNEPRITAWYAGKLGWWPPYRRGWSGFVAVMLAVCRGIARTTRVLTDAEPDALILHVDACDLYEATAPSLQAEAELRQNIGFLALDLVSGRVDEHHPLHDWLLAHGASRAELAVHLREPVALDVVGMNLYPLFSLKRLSRRGGRLRATMPYAGSDLVERLSALYYGRYARPLIISETASEGSVARRGAWLDASVASIARLRSRGVPVLGYTWWPLFALVAWAYREGTRPAAEYLKQMGLWDLEMSDDGRLERVATPLVGRYRALATSGAVAVGPLASPSTLATRG